MLCDSTYILKGSIMLVSVKCVTRIKGLPKQAAADDQNLENVSQNLHPLESRPTDSYWLTKQAQIVLSVR
jgi:hypothetical protein